MLWEKKTIHEFQKLFAPKSACLLIPVFINFLKCSWTWMPFKIMTILKMKKIALELTCSTVLNFLSVQVYCWLLKSWQYHLHYSCGSLLLNFFLLTMTFYFCESWPGVWNNGCECMWRASFSAQHLQVPQWMITLIKHSPNTAIAPRPAQVLLYQKVVSNFLGKEGNPAHP